MIHRNCVFLLLVGFATVFAQQISPALTLEQAWEIAVRNNLALRQQKKLVDQAGEETLIRKSEYLPVLSASASYQYISELAELTVPFQVPGVTPIKIEAGVRNQYDLTLWIKQPVFTGFRIRNSIRSARQQHQASRLQADVIRQRLLWQVGLLYYNIQLNLLQSRVLDQAIERADFHLQKVRNFFHAQRSTPFDTLEVSNRKLRLESQSIQLKNNQRILISRLRHLLNQDTIPPIELFSIEAVELSLGSLEEYFQEAVSHRPELEQIIHTQQAQQLQMKVLQSRYYPQIFALASYHYARPGVNFFEDRWMDYYTVGIQLQWELWDWKRVRRKVRQARLALQRLSLQEQALLRDIKQQVTEAFQQLQNVREQIRLQHRVVSQERERYRMARERFMQGMVTSLDLSDAEKSLTAAELQLQQNYIEWFRSLLKLHYATGTIGE